MNSEDESYVAQLIEKMKSQMGMGIMNPPKSNGSPDQSPDQSPGGPIVNNSITTSNVNEQGVLSNIKNSSPPTPAKGIFPDCPQCGTMHPPLRPGEICPMKKVEVVEAGVTDDDINRFLSQLKNISVSQIQSKGIKDGNKLFKHLIVEIAKFLEEYRE